MNKKKRLLLPQNTSTYLERNLTNKDIRNFFLDYSIKIWNILISKKYTQIFIIICEDKRISSHFDKKNINQSYSKQFNK